MKKAAMDSLIGMPFMLLPGCPPDHVICGEVKRDSTKIQANAVMQVFNDMLLIDAVEGSGAYKTSGLSDYNAAALEIAERLYGVSCADALKHWMTLPRCYKALEWPGGRTGSPRNSEGESSEEA